MFHHNQVQFPLFTYIHLVEGNNEPKTEFAQRKITIKKVQKRFVVLLLFSLFHSELFGFQIALVVEPEPFVVLIVEMQLLDSNFFVVFSITKWEKGNHFNFPCFTWKLCFRFHQLQLLVSHFFVPFLFFRIIISLIGTGSWI